MIQNVKNCPRCKGSHDKLVFRAFRGQQGNDGWSHWSMCPTHSEPIFLQVGGGSKEPAMLAMKGEWVDPLDEIQKIINDSSTSTQDRVAQVGVIIQAAKE